MESERTDGSAMSFDGRAQSTFDYAIGVSVFVVVVFAVFAFFPTAFGGFGGDSPGTAGDGLAADRSVDHFTKTILGSAGPDRALDVGCAVLFFSDDPSHPDIDVTRADCELDGPRSGSVPGVLSLSSTTGVNVTIEADFGSGRTLACWDTSSETVVDSGSTACGDDSNDVKFGAGSRTADNPDFASAERYGTIDGTDAHVHVRVW